MSFEPGLMFRGFVFFVHHRLTHPLKLAAGRVTDQLPLITLALLKTKKADVAEHLEVFDHAGLLVNEPPGKAGLPFI